MLLVKICIVLMALFHGGRVRVPLQESRSSKAERIALIQRWLREIQDRLIIIPGVRGGVGLLDVRATMELGDGALIFTTYGGVVDLGPEGHNLFLKPILRARTCESFQGIRRAIRNICGSTACNVSVLACLMSRSRG